MNSRRSCCNTKVKPCAGRYFDPVKKHYYRTSNLFITDLDCHASYPNRVEPADGRYYDVYDGHYYRIGRLFGINECKRRPICTNHHHSAIIVPAGVPCTDPTESDNIFFNEADQTYYKMRRNPTLKK